MDLFEMDLDRFGAPGFTFRDRLDMTGHRSGLVDPHINSEIVPRTVIGRDLAHIQLDGFNRMQRGE